MFNSCLALSDEEYENCKTYTIVNNIQRFMLIDFHWNFFLIFISEMIIVRKYNNIDQTQNEKVLILKGHWTKNKWSKSIIIFYQFLNEWTVKFHYYWEFSISQRNGQRVFTNLLIWKLHPQKVIFWMQFVIVGHIDSSKMQRWHWNLFVCSWLYGI